LRRLLPVVVLSYLLASPAPAQDAGPAPARPAYPATRQADVVDVVHGERVADPYRWLEDDHAPEVVAWDRAQQGFTRRRLDAVPRREELRRRIETELDLATPRSLPTFEGGREWYVEKPAGANHGVVYARDRDGAGEPRAIVDPNAWSEDGTEGLTGWHPSPDGRWLAYLRAPKGSEASTLHLKDLASGADTDLRITRTKHASLAWAPDASGFWYSRQPDPDSVPAGEHELHRRVHWHPIGGLVLDDEVVYGRGRPAIESMYVHPSSDRKTTFLVRGQPYETNETFEIRRVDGRTTFVPLVMGVDARTYVDRIGDRYVLLTDHLAPRKRVCVASAEKVGDPACWREIVPEGKGVIRSVDAVGDLLVLHEVEDVVSRLRVVDLDGKDRGEIRFPGAGAAASVHDVATKPGDTRAWFSADGYDHPWTSYVVDLASKELAPTALVTGATTVTADRLVTTRARFASKDGTSIPVFVLHRRDVALDGKAPTVLSGYGGFRIGRYPSWSAVSALWADLGGVHVVACLRGGDEFGETWHAAGCLANKQNVFDDFIAAADGLVAKGWVARERLAIHGGSNGGLLVAACANQRPDLCRAVVCSVPLTDMLRFHRFQFAKIWTKEYGDPELAEQCGWLRPYSPYHNVRDGAAYPAALVTAGLEDGRVNAFHARKIAARWQAATSSDRPILLSIDRDSGHGSASRKQMKADVLDRFCFLTEELGK
jgi:prolyl oligopeptidase